MIIIEIAALENGAHRNQTLHGSAVPDGWAVIPASMEIPVTFPFVEVEAKNGVVTSMRAGVMPDLLAEPEPEITELEQLRADVDYIAIMSGIEL